MKRSKGMELKFARRMAETTVDLLASACERIEIAGSVRRQKKHPNDLEIVVAPLVTQEANAQEAMFGGYVTPERHDYFEARCAELLRKGVFEKRLDKNNRAAWGERLKRAIVYDGKDYAPLDLFAVIEPAQWGVIYALRTGPGSWNRLLVTSRRWGGACPLDRKVAGGRVWFIDPSREDLAKMPASKFARLAEAGSIEAGLIRTPTEKSFFEQLQVPYLDPWNRTKGNLKQLLRQM